MFPRALPARPRPGSLAPGRVGSSGKRTSGSWRAPVDPRPRSTVRLRRCPTDWAGSVSYTHLDVYKRQDSRFSFVYCCARAIMSVWRARSISGLPVGLPSQCCFVVFFLAPIIPTVIVRLLIKTLILTAKTGILTHTHLNSGCVL